jgi:hypothetical protein
LKLLLRLNITPKISYVKQIFLDQTRRQRPLGAPAQLRQLRPITDLKSARYPHSLAKCNTKYETLCNLVLRFGWEGNLWITWLGSFSAEGSAVRLTCNPLTFFSLQIYFLLSYSRHSSVLTSIGMEKFG